MTFGKSSAPAKGSTPCALLRQKVLHTKLCNMAALRRVQIYWENPPTGAFEVEYEDTLRPNRRVIERYPARGFVSVGEGARITGTPRRTLYHWLTTGEVDYVETDDGNYRIPMSEIRRLLGKE